MYAIRSYYGRAVDPKVLRAVWGFFAVYVVTFALLMLGMMSYNFV